MPEIKKQKHGGALAILKKGETANRNGRPPKLLGSIVKQLKSEGYEPVTQASVLEAFSVSLGLTKKRLQQIVADADTPIVLGAVAERLLGKDAFEVASLMLDRLYGKALQPTSIDVSGTDWFAKLPEDEQFELVKVIEEKRFKSQSKVTTVDFEEIPKPKPEKATNKKK